MSSYFKPINKFHCFIFHVGENVIISDKRGEKSAFNIIEGWADPGMSSFESVDTPKQYLRHSNYRILLTGIRTGNDGDKKDATFKIVLGLCGAGISFESKNFPGYYIRHRDGGLHLVKFEDSDYFRLDATFIEQKA